MAEIGCGRTNAVAPHRARNASLCAAAGDFVRQPPRSMELAAPDAQTPPLKEPLLERQLPQEEPMKEPPSAPQPWELFGLLPQLEEAELVVQRPKRRVAPRLLERPEVVQVLGRTEPFRLRVERDVVPPARVDPPVVV